MIFKELISNIKMDDKKEEINNLTKYSYQSHGIMFEYFVGYEITTLLGYKNPKSAITHSVSKSNQIIFKDYPGVKDPELDPRTILITRDGVVEILLKTRKRLSPDVLHILKEFGIETTNRKCLTKEQQTLSTITDAFKTEKYEDQYKVGSYYLDLYFTDYKIVSECDERGHADRRACNERERMDYINEELRINDSHWIRFNPDAYDFDITQVIRKIYNKIKEFDNKKFEKKLLELTNQSEKKLLKLTNESEIKIKKITEESKNTLNQRRCTNCYEKKDLCAENFLANGVGFSLTCIDCNSTTGKEKPVLQYELDGTFVQLYSSVKEAAEEMKLFPSAIAACARDVVKTAGNYMWKFQEKVGDFPKKVDKVKYELYKEVAQYVAETGELVKTYKSVGEACREIGVKPRSVYQAIKKNFVSHGFIWKYVENNEILPSVTPVSKRRRYMKGVEIYKDGVLFKKFISIKESSVEMNVNITIVRKYLDGKKKDPNNYEWKFENIKEEISE
jgi:very-short-patch-repair endonuclease